MNEKTYSVLICDDSAMIRKTLRFILEEWGVRNIFEARNGSEAVDIYRERHPDLVFMDIVMPEKSGLDALVEIREEDPSARVVMASTTGTKKNLMTAIDAGAFDFIQKPFEKDIIHTILRRILKGELD
ncbi:response regulator [Aminivibrio sp.]|uniref:response regulator n=1 Tax=Aminivibrio sp. TaxID=1872489 RepID=UPI001A49BBCA|nr:response regulator [Aminivibrio sp.]MBL3540281.1 response regulator [Aminivibrio sp.]MDK2958834.1 two-component system, chemotaxis family, chemotaxis protein CheY [Synergistaceae bacterium]